MSMTVDAGAYGSLVRADTLEIQRLLPGPIERVWAYLVDSEKRRQWLAAGDMALVPGSAFELTWHNDTITDPAGEPPPGMTGRHTMACRVIDAEPPHRLVFAFGPHGEVAFTLAKAGERVLLTLVHRRIPSRETLLRVSAGWHAHLDVLVARSGGENPAPFWDSYRLLMAAYAERFAGG